MHSVEDHDLITDWSLPFDELSFIGTKRRNVRFGFAGLLRFRQTKGRFPNNRTEVLPAAIAYLAQQTGGNVAEWDTFHWTPRSSLRQRADILAFSVLGACWGKILTKRRHG